MTWDVWIVAGYVMLLTAMGLRGGRKVKTAADFSAGDSRYGAGVLFASLSASYVGGGYSAGNAGEAFENGIGTTLALCGFSVAMILTGKYLVPGVERFRGQSTVGGVIGQAYGRPAQILTGIFSFFCCAGVVAAQMEGMGQVFHTLLGISPLQGILLGSSIVLVYSTFGGLQSVIAADVVQFVLLAAGLPLLLWLGLREAGGFGAVWQAIPAAYKDPLNGRGLLGFLSLFFSMMFGEALAPPYTQRLLVGKNAGETARATVASGWFSLPVFCVTGCIGLTAYVLRVTDAAELAMPALIVRVLPTGVRGLVMAAMLSIMLSAADGFLNSAAISLVCDTVKPLKPEISDRSQLFWLRFVNVAVGVLGIVIAVWVGDIMDILMLAYGFWCPLILPPLAAALLGIDSDGRTFCRALFSGLAATLVWTYLAGSPGGVDGSMVGMLVNTAVFAADTRRRRKRDTVLLKLQNPARKRRIVLKHTKPGGTLQQKDKIVQKTEQSGFCTMPPK